jgi:cell division septum initiation protein DivIVA
MSTMPIDSVFGVPEPPPDTHPDMPTPGPGKHLAAPESDETAAPAGEVEWVNTELRTIASTIEELQGRLEEANTRLATASVVETTEFEIGRLFVEAQRFSEESLSKLDLKIHEILCEAEAKAKEILAEATEEAHEIRRQAQQAAFGSTRTARELQSAIAGFTTVNNELLRELGALNSMLTPASERGTSEIEASGAPETD